MSTSPPDEPRASQENHSSESGSAGQEQPATVEDQLEKASTDLKQKQSELDKDTKKVTSDTSERDALKAQVAQLTNAVKEIGQAGGELEKILPPPGDIKKELQDYEGREIDRVKKILGPDKVQAVDDVVKKYDAKLEGQKKWVKGLGDEMGKAQAAYVEAQSDLSTAKKHYDDLKSYPKTVVTKLKFADMRKAIEAQEQNHEVPNFEEKTYLRLRFMEEALKDPVLNPILTDAQLKNKLNHAWNALQKASIWVDATKAASEKATKDWEAAKKALKELEDNRSNHLLEWVDEEIDSATTATATATA